MLRGIDGRAIFLNDSDRFDFLSRMDEILTESGMRCFAWTLMTNHVHAVVQTGPVPLSSVMQRLNAGYAMRFNRRCERRGYVFQDRYRSRIAENDADLVGLVRYVHRNPLAAGLVRSHDELRHHPWCGHGALLGVARPRRFHSVAEALSLFSDRPPDAREALESWMQASAEDDMPPPGDPLETLLTDAERRFSVPAGRIREGGRDRVTSRARAWFIRQAVEHEGVPAIEVSRFLGVRPSSVSRALRRPRG
jgi:REP element-mobilizing transposase RayT